MLRVCRNVDTLACHIFLAQILVDAEPVLERQDAEHRRTCQMLGHNLVANLASSLLRSIATAHQSLVIVVVGTVVIFFPPAAQGAHVVS